MCSQILKKQKQFSEFLKFVTPLLDSKTQTLLSNDTKFNVNCDQIKNDEMQL